MNPRFLAVFVLSLLIGVGVCSLAETEAMERAELSALDVLFRARYAVHGPLAVDPRILIVSVDEASFKTVGKPFILWHEEFARVLDTLRSSQVAAVGFDLILNPERDQLPPSDPVRLRLERGERALAQVILEDPVVIIEQLGVKGSADLRSGDLIHFAALARDRVAFANTLTDQDGFVRRAPFLFSEGAPGRTRAFFGKLAEMATDTNLSLENRGPHLGKVALPDAGEESLRINYPGPRGTFPEVPMSEILTHRGSPIPGLKGKICILIPGALSFQDLLPTPFHLQPGGEVHAAALNTMLTGAFVQRAPASLWIGLTLGMAVLLGLAATSLAPGRGLVALVLAVILYQAAALECFSQAGTWIPVIGPLLAGVVAFGGGYVQRYLTVEKARRRIRELFGRFVSPQVMKELLSHPDRQQLGGTRRRISVLFCDINDFTPTCERLTPEEIIEMLNRYFEEMVHIIFRNGGTIKQFVGDEIMVLFGAPEPQPDHALMAVRTALEMLARLEELARQSEGRRGFYEVKIGVHTGEVVVGNVGAQDRSEYAAVGDTVNLTARIESLAKTLGKSLLVSEVTREAVGSSLPEVEWISCGPQKFKGKSVEMVVYQLRRNQAPPEVAGGPGAGVQAGAAVGSGGCE